MTQKWKLQDIRPPERERRKVRKEETSGTSRQSDVKPRKRASQTQTRRDAARTPNRTAHSRGGFRNVVLTLGAIVVLAVVGFGITFFLRGAEVMVYPKFKDVVVEATFTSTSEPQVGDLGHEILILEEIGRRSIEATGEEETQERARGTITIFNEFSSSPQRLIKNTRFESPDGLVYRISDSVVVPGFTRDDNDIIIPGSIVAEVFADGDGDRYNIAATRFTIPGLEGTDQFEDMYATSDEPFTGGFEGLKFVVDEENFMTVQEELRVELIETLTSRLQSERPAGFELFDEAITFEFDPLPSFQNEDGTVSIEEHGRLIVPLFGDAEFASYIAQNTIAGYEGEPVRIEDSALLTFAYLAATTSPNVSEESNIEFTLSGNIRVIWEFGREQLQNDLLGLSKTALPSVLSGYPAIERAEAVIRPFWKQSFPEDTKDIEVVEILEKPK